jgi:beta-lactam-binding protein with PASTA domain
VALRFFSGQQPNLGIGNHAALLANKRFAPPALPSPPPVSVPDVTELNKKNASDFVRAAGLVPKYRERTSGNWVARQEPAAGTLVPRGSTVVLSLRPNAPN